MDSVKVTNIEWQITKKEIEKYGDYAKAVKALNLPDEVELIIEYNEFGTPFNAINKELKKQYKHTCFDCEYEFDF